MKEGQPLKALFVSAHKEADSKKGHLRPSPFFLENPRISLQWFIQSIEITMLFHIASVIYLNTTHKGMENSAVGYIIYQQRYHSRIV